MTDANRSTLGATETQRVVDGTHGDDEQKAAREVLTSALVEAAMAANSESEDGVTIRRVGNLVDLSDLGIGAASEAGLDTEQAGAAIMTLVLRTGLDKLVRATLRRLDFQVVDVKAGIWKSKDAMDSSEKRAKARYNQECGTQMVEVGESEEAALDAQ